MNIPDVDVLKSVLKEVREYTDMPIIFIEEDFSENHVFCKRGQFCNFVEYTTHVQVFVKEEYTTHVQVFVKEAVIEKLSTIQKEFILKKYFEPTASEIASASSNFPYWKKIATKLLDEGQCLVPEYYPFWRLGNIGNFIEKKVADSGFGVMIYAFDTKKFLSSAFFKSTVDSEIEKVKKQITELSNLYSEIDYLIKNNNQ